MIGVYVFAGVVALLAGAIAVLLPIWLRGGMPELRRQSGWLIPTFAGSAILVAAISAANAFGLGSSVDLGLALASIAVAVLWLSRTDPRLRLSPPLRILAWLALIVSIALVILALKNAF